MIGIIDYGAGNLMSVSNALAQLGAKKTVIRNPEDMQNMKKIILPGVGSFGKASASLQELGMDTAIKEWVAGGKLFLGICLGMQLLFEQSEESPEMPGLGIFSGSVQKIKARKVPQMGWNTIDNTRGKLFEGAGKGYAYFANSYYCNPVDSSIISGQTRYGKERFCSALEQNNVFATQFHLEKSGNYGLMLLKNFISQEDRL
jgi:imidazole glycerol-phosphate synthase subunit HisH